MIVAEGVHVVYDDLAKMHDLRFSAKPGSPGHSVRAPAQPVSVGRNKPLKVGNPVVILPLW